MERVQEEAAIEAILFTMGESVEVSKLAEVIGEIMIEQEDAFEDIYITSKEAA